MLVAPPAYLDLLEAVQRALNPSPMPKPLIIGIDGLDGAGKTSVASWLAWQLGLPAFYLDAFIDPEAEKLTWHVDDLRRMLDERLHPDRPRPVVVEGVLLLDVLARANRKPDFLVYVERRGNEGSHYFGRDHVQPYLQRRSPRHSADFIVKWEPP